MDTVPARTGRRRDMPIDRKAIVHVIVKEDVAERVDVRRAVGERAREVVRHGLGAVDKSVTLVERLL